MEIILLGIFLKQIKQKQRVLLFIENICTVSNYGNWISREPGTLLKRCLKYAGAFIYGEWKKIII